MVNDRRKWIKTAFHKYNANKARLPQLKEDYAKIPIPCGVGGGNGGGSAPSGNGTERSVLHYLIDRERLETAIKNCENQIAIVDKTLQHFTVEGHAKGKKHDRYIKYRFIRGMSYTRAAIECEISERASALWMEEIFNVAEAIAEIEGYFS